MAFKPKSGTVLLKEGNFFLEAEGKLTPIPVSPQAHPANLKALVGKKVELLYSEPKSFIAGLVGPTRIICYFPADPWLTVVDEGARVGLAKQFLNEGYISQETFQKLAGEQE